MQGVIAKRQRKRQKHLDILPYLLDEMKDVYIGKDVLELYDKYDQEFGLLDERWASEKDRRSASLMETTLFEEYIDKLYLIKTDGYSTAMKAEALKRIEYIEGVMEPSVAETLRKRVFGY